MTLKIITLGVMTPGKMALSIMTPGKMALSIMTLQNDTGLLITLGVMTQDNYTWRNDTW